jgi:hypothetical protein
MFSLVRGDLMFKKRGQITIFIIIGIVLLLTIILFFYIRSTAIKKIPSAVTVKEVPTELNPVRIFVQDCLKDTVVNGFRLLGSRGGYIHPEEHGITANAFEPTEGTGVSFFPDDPNSPPVAYWEYFKSRNRCYKNCECGSEQPPLCKIERDDCFSRGENSIEEQLEEYIVENLDFCFQDFVPLIGQGFDVKIPEEMDVEITITRDDVRAYLEYPLEIKKGDVKETVPDFYVEFQFNFMKIYEFASQITKAQRMYYFFGKWVINIIDGLGGINSVIPKTYYVDFSPGNSKYWSEMEAKEQIMNNVLPYYIPLLRIYNTENYEPLVLESDIATGIYRFRDLPVGTSQGFDYSDLKVNFNYFPHWPIYLDIRGRGVQGDYIGPEQGSAFEELFSWLGLKRYQYYYDISFPVIVEVIDQTQDAQNLFGSSGYNFQFALEANVRGNEDLNCSGSGEPLLLPPMSSLMCKRLHFKSGDIVIETKDTSGNPLADVQITYQCGRETGCPIGYTEIETNESSPYHGKAILKTKLPYPCAGGNLKVTRFKYYLDPVLYSTTPKRNDTIVIELEPIRTVNVTVVKKRIVKFAGSWSPAPGFGSMLPNEKVMISLERIKTSPASEEFVRSFSFNGSDPYTTVELIPGDYKVSGLFMYELPALNRDEVVFADERVCTGLEIGGECTGDWEIMHIDPFNDTFMEGGVELESVPITAALLDDYNIIYFKVVSVPDSASFGVLSFSDLETLGSHDAWSMKLGAELNPGPPILTYGYTQGGPGHPAWGLFFNQT